MQCTEAARIAELEADNSRLRRLLDQRNAPAELRHRLRGTLALLRRIIRRSAERYTELTAYAAHLEDRLGALARIQAAIDVVGSVDLATLAVEELLFYAVKEGEQLKLAGPAVSLQPRAGQALGLAIHEMAVNAVEHGALTAGGRVEIWWQLDQQQPTPLFTLNWKETGVVGLNAPAREGFGTEVLTSMLRYEIKAETSIALERDGMRYTISFPFPPEAGALVEEPDLREQASI